MSEGGTRTQAMQYAFLSFPQQRKSRHDEGDTRERERESERERERQRERERDRERERERGQ